MSCPDGFWCLQFRDYLQILVLVATIFAIYFGPIRAVQVSRRNDERNRKLERQFSIFSNLMKTRRVILDPLHVASLNLIDVEFHDHDEVIGAYRANIDHLNKVLPPRGAELDKFINERDDLLFDLIHSIGLKLGYKYDKRDLKKFSYSPQGWQTVESEQQTFRQLVIEVLSGRRPLPVKNFVANDVLDKFPPPPA